MTAPDAPPPTPAEELAEPDEARARVFPCFECGADLEFSITAQDLACPYCGVVQPIEIGEDAEVRERDLEAALEADAGRRQSRRAKEGGETLREVQCGSCAATVQFPGTLTSLECPYCTTPVQLEGAHQAEEGLPVDGVLPFQVEESAADRELQQWIRSRWFLPSDLQQRGVSGRFQGVYLPYWTFDAMTANRYRGERGEHYWVEEGSGDDKRRVRRTRWSPARGEFRRFFDDVLVVAGRGLPVSLLRKLEPWPLQKVLPFAQELLAGRLARRYDHSLRDGFQEGRGIMARRIEDEVRRRIGGDEQRVHSIDTNWAGLSYKHLLLPVYLLSYKYGEKIYQVTINAATGEVQGERPYSAIKIAIAVALVMAVVGGIWFLAR